MPSSSARATPRSRSAGAPRTISPPTSPQPNPSADTRSPVRPSTRYSMAVTYSILAAVRPAVARPAVACPPGDPRLPCQTYAPRPPRPHRALRLAPLSRHDDVRPAVRRGRLGGDPGSRGGRRHHLPRHRGRLPARRRLRDGGAHRGDPRPLAGRAPPRLRARHQVLRGDERPAVGPRRLAQARA